MKVALVPTHLLHTCWDEVSRQLHRLEVVSDGRMSVQKTFDDVLFERLQLWVAINDDDRIVGVVTSRITDYPYVRLLTLEGCAGYGLLQWIGPMHDILEKWAKDNACNGMEMTGRRGWKRKLSGFGWKTHMVTYQKVF